MTTDEPHDDSDVLTSAGLHRSAVHLPGIGRQRYGVAWTYTDPSGRPLSDEGAVARVTALHIPPAWSSVWIAPDPLGHIQATGFDAAGQMQYLYHLSWRRAKDAIKFDRALELAAALPSARLSVADDLNSAVGSRSRVLAAAFRILDTASLRVGNERYAEAHGSIGLATLRNVHATVRGTSTHLSFTGKSHHAWESTLEDAPLAQVIRSLKRRGSGEPLLAFHHKTGWRPLRPTEINEYVRSNTGGHFTAKDFRTLHGTLTAAVSLATTGHSDHATDRTKAIRQSIVAASHVLENTPTVARDSYIDPRVFQAFEEGRVLDLVGDLGPLEHRLRHFILNGAPHDQRS